jgi:CheY-like chemotaxis protein
VLFHPKKYATPSSVDRFRYFGLVGMEMASACTVLVVEDEPLIRSHLVRMLQDQGCKTYEAGSAAEAIAIMEANSEITVVFTDIQMPGTMDGIALAQYVRKRWPPTIIVVSSGKTQPAAGVLAEDIPFVAKPYDDRRLSEVMGHVCERLASA